MANEKKLYGIAAIAAGIAVYAFRPAASCKWYEIFCNAGGLVTSPIYLIISLILIIGGAAALLSK